ncbi:MAG: hypothetical protein WAV07_15735 [Candidatus Contendobacter sp.]
MYIADDPTLALITRFVGDAQNLNLSDAEFLLRQIAAIEQYVEPFPAGERQERALEWIAAHARHYRQQWQKQAAAGVLAHARCPDCPLDGGGRTTPCAVHERWLELLRRYAATEISSRDYVEDSLKLLGRYKDRLKVGRTRQRRQYAIPVLDPG